MKNFIIIITVIIAIFVGMVILEENEPQARQFKSLVVTSQEVSWTTADKMVVPKGIIVHTEHNGVTAIWFNSKDCGTVVVSQIYPGHNVNLYKYTTLCKNHIFNKLSDNELNSLLANRS